MQLLWKSEAPAGKRYREYGRMGNRIFARRSDEVLVELDPATGKPLRESPLLWEPESLATRVIQETAFLLSTSGHAYAIRLGK